MPTSFFDADVKVPKKVALPLVAECHICKLDKTCHSPKMPVRGHGSSKIMVIAEAPGKTEDEQNRPLVGESGQLFQAALAKAGVDMWRDCWVTNSVICRPPRNVPPPKAIGHCRPNVVKAINELKPETMILLGAAAVKSVIGWLWKEDPRAMERWAGWKIPSQRLNCWICPTWHPSFILRQSKGRETSVEKLLFERQIKAAVKLKGRPWKKVPDFHSKVKVVMNPDEAAELIRQIIKAGIPVAFDYETNMTKPDSKESEIISCSISNGKTTISYPWHGEAITATKELLLSDVPKWAHNEKFEWRWTRKHLGCRIKNLQWCSMTNAHILDNRSGITGLKFQLFTQFGLESYDDEIKPYMKSKGSNLPNRLREFPLPKTLLYGGIDALGTWKLCSKQRKEFGLED